MYGKVATKRGFTLIEVLVVMGVIGVLVAIMVPAIQYAREAARRSTCRNNLKQIGLALHNYHDVHGTFPPAWTYAPNLPGSSGPMGSHVGVYSWSTYLLPYLDQATLYDAMGVHGSSIQAPTTPEHLNTPLSVYRCPTDTSAVRIRPRGNGNIVLGGQDNKQNATSNYLANWGTSGRKDGRRRDPHAGNNAGDAGGFRGNGLCFQNSRVRIADVTDGTSNVFAVGEVCQHTKPPNIFNRNGSGWWVGLERRSGSNKRLLSAVRGCRRRLNERHHAAFGSLHPGGGHFLMCDGSVRFVNETIEYRNGPNSGNVNATPEVRGLYQRLGIRDDGAVTDDF